MRIHQFDDPVKQAHFEEIIKYPEQFAICIDAQYYDGNLERWVPIDKKQIVQNSTKFSLQASDTTDISIGGVYLGQAEFTMDFSVPEPQGGFIDKRVYIFFMFFDPQVPYGDQPSGYPFPVFQHMYTVTNSVDSERGRTLTLVDDMQRFDKSLPMSYAPSGSLYEIVNRICDKCNVSFGMTQQEVEALPNGSEVWGYYPENDCQTYRDVLHWISQAVCGFCYIDEYRGGLVIHSYAEGVDYDVVAATERVKGATLASYATQITAATFTNADGSISTIGSTVLGKTYDCGLNPFLIYGLATTVTRMRTAVFDVLYSMRFKPFNAKVIVPPIYDLGDKLYFTGGNLNSDGYYSCVQKIEWSLQGMTLQGFGQNPKVASKASSSAVRQATKASEMVIKKYNNYSAIHVGSTETIATQIDFSALRAGCEVEMWEEFLCDVTVDSSPMTVTAYYYLDGTLLDRRPIETFTDSGEHILDLHYSETIQDAGLHRWIVKLECSGGTIDFDIDDCLAVLKGQGLEKEGSWSGLIVCSDVITTLDLHNILQGLTDTGRVLIQNVLSDAFSDQIPNLRMATVTQTINENRRVTLRVGDHILRCGRGDRCGLGRTFGGLT